MITLFIDNKEVKTKAGNTILWAALDNNLYIPNLCAIRDSEKQNSSCRLCFVEIKGNSSPVPACSTQVHQNMQVLLNTPEVARIRATGFHLIMSNHRLNCNNCIKNKSCELQEISKKTGLKLTNRKLHHIAIDIPVDDSHPNIYFDRSKCVLCGKCIAACNQSGSGILDFAYRGIKTMITTFKSKPLVESGCMSCMACVSVCPVGALGRKKHR
jgi:bidirectional [NiFe] hydrogenase diaphorase subunit